MRARFLVEARAEFDAAVDFYDAEAPGLGREFLLAIEAATGRLLENPHAGAPYVERTRRLLVRRFPYSLIYVPEQHELVVVAIAHQRRKPGYWTDRM